MGYRQFYLLQLSMIVPKGHFPWCFFNQFRRGVRVQSLPQRLTRPHRKIPIGLRRQEGGLMVKKFFPKWAHLPYNSLGLLRYDPSKLRHFCVILQICKGKLSKFAYKFIKSFEVLSQTLQLTHDLVSVFRDMEYRNACKGFVIF